MMGPLFFVPLVGVLLALPPQAPAPGDTVKAAAPAPEPSPSALATARLREAHRHLRAEMERTAATVSGLTRLDAAAQAAATGEIVRFFTARLQPHAAEEEAGLYRVVDVRAGAGKERFTASMRHEHRIVGRSIALLEKASASKPFDAAAFARSADRLLALVEAHFEVEEEVLLPILDRTMTAAEVEHELGGHAH